MKDSLSDEKLRDKIRSLISENPTVATNFVGHFVEVSSGRKALVVAVDEGPRETSSDSRLKDSQATLEKVEVEVEVQLASNEELMSAMEPELEKLVSVVLVELGAAEWQPGQIFSQLDQLSDLFTEIAESLAREIVKAAGDIVVRANGSITTGGTTQSEE